MIAPPRCAAALALLLLPGCAASSAAAGADPAAREIAAARALVRWLVEDAELPGHGEPPADRWVFDRAARVFVICEFVPAELPLSDEPRVERIPASAAEAHFAEYGFEDTVYVRLRRDDEAAASDRPLVLWCRYSFGTVGAQAYRFTFRGHGDALRAEGRLMISA